MLLTSRAYSPLPSCSIESGSLGPPYSATTWPGRSGVRATSPRPQPSPTSATKQRSSTHELIVFATSNGRAQAVRRVSIASSLMSSGSSRDGSGAISKPHPPIDASSPNARWREHHQRSCTHTARSPHEHNGVRAQGGGAASKPQPSPPRSHHHRPDHQTHGLPQWQSGLDSPSCSSGAASAPALGKHGGGSSACQATPTRLVQAALLGTKLVFRHDALTDGGLGAADDGAECFPFRDRFAAASAVPSDSWGASHVLCASSGLSPQCHVCCARINVCNGGAQRSTRHLLH